ncbi:patatin-like phospholipase RssA [Ferrimonas lipolytica]|uniref:Patatin-like phospholipase RssA n=1 Tax=Ferrimonas lipolytica TaxID=2724191 RepID=A0A6H1UF31_9GAMM|nr:patatin-like phospholipase RssA [Ferrimonas lipolytica]QIZ77239.1 patatin-like phospholipase RssA [Ferrimonas lipolytica]
MDNDIRIGIALGSGAAKGWAHIGVLRGLDRLGIKPNLVAGCSIGAFVGAAYAAGKLDELEQWVCNFSGWDVFNLLDLSWRRGGIIGGERVFAAATEAIGINSVDELTMPFIAVATDLYSGQEVWLEQGKLEDVVGASCAIPGFVMPKQIGNRWLVDGAVVNPVPVSAARALGADMVIAVDLHGDGRQHGEMPVRINTDKPLESDDELASSVVPVKSHSGGFMDLLVSGREFIDRITDSFSGNDAAQSNALAVMHQSMEILEQRHKRSKMMGDPPEVVVLPQVGDIVTIEFQRAADAIEAGEAAVARVAHILEAEVARLQQARHLR